MNGFNTYNGINGLYDDDSYYNTLQPSSRISWNDMTVMPGGKLASTFRNKLKGLNNISLRNVMKNGVGDPELLGWNSKKGLSVLGGDVGGLYTGGKGLMDTFSYLNSAKGMSDAKQEGNDIKSEILASAASNPLASQYLTQDEV